MILGTQWYILFTYRRREQHPAEMRHATINFGVKGWLWWRKVANSPRGAAVYVTAPSPASGRLLNAPGLRTGDWVIRDSRARLGSYIADARRPTIFTRSSRVGVISLIRGGHHRVFWRPLYYYASASIGSRDRMRA